MALKQYYSNYTLSLLWSNTESLNYVSDKIYKFTAVFVTNCKNKRLTTDDKR
jgi:hypothetical protein